MHRLNSGNVGVVQKAAGKLSLQEAKHILTALQRLPKCTQASVTKARKNEQAAKNAWLYCLYCTYPKMPPNTQRYFCCSCHSLANWLRNLRTGSWLNTTGRKL